MTDRDSSTPPAGGFSLKKPKIDEEEMNRGRFDVIPSNAILDDYDSPLPQSDSPSGSKKKKTRYNRYEADPDDATEEDSGSEGVSGDNYRHMYLEQMEQGDLAFSGKRAEAKLKNLQEKEGKAAAEKQQEEVRQEQERAELRGRARDLQEQIGYWQNQRGVGVYDESRIVNEIEDLKRQLGAIPTGLW